MHIGDYIDDERSKSIRGKKILDELNENNFIFNR